MNEEKRSLFEKMNRIRRKQYYQKNKERLKKYKSEIYYPRLLKNHQKATYDIKTISELRNAITKWSNNVKQKDGHKCVKCGSKKDLIAHHIIPRNIDMTKALDTQNSITLCKYCHDIGNVGSIHTLISNRYTTKQFQKWLDK